MNPKALEIKQFDYVLPDEKVAKFPLHKRDESRLLIFKKAQISEDIFFNVDEHLPGNSLVILNNTKVIEARLLFKNEAGADIEIFCLEPADETMNLMDGMLMQKQVQWKCLVGNARKWKDETLEKKILTVEKNIVLTAKKTTKQQDYFLVDFFWKDDITFAEVLHLAGVIPLPPYLNRKAEATDKETYQTVYAANDGSVAAPTAGLHFTDELFKKLSTKNINTDFITLHVGAGTFKPVKTETIEQHNMHTEYFEVSAALIENMLKNINETIVAVGTTTLRTLESLYWMGVKLIDKSKLKSKKEIVIEDINIKQWDVYDMQETKISAEESLQVLLLWLQENHQTKLVAKTQILIAAPYKLKIAKVLITNFHQPKSTLLLLVAAVIGDDWKRMYNYALEHNFRFLSYGDACLLMP